MTHKHPLHSNATLLALDVGERRIGVAIASVAARLARPLKTLERNDQTLEEVQNLVQSEQAIALIVGLPRNLSGQATAQTVAVEHFAAEVRQVVGIPLHWQDEAVTSRQAEAELQARGKAYSKADIDALSATYILEDFLRDHPEVRA